MKIFAILYCYPPLLVPATMCYLKLVIGLKKLGHDVEVLTIVPESFNAPDENLIDPTMNALVPDGVVNHEVWSWENNLLIKACKRFGVTYRMGYRLWEPKKKEWVAPALRHIRNKIDMTRFDAVLSCSQPHVNHLIGLNLKRRHGLPWVAYLSDPWTDMPWGEYSSQKIADYHLELERQVITSADAVLFTSQETVDLVMKKYPTELMEKCAVLPHAYVPDWFERVNSPALEAVNRRLEILHTGHFYGQRTPLPVFRALQRLHAERSITDKIHFTFVGGMAEEYRRYVIDKGLESFITIGKAIPYLQSLALMARSDYLLMVDAPLRLLLESVFLPSKLVDYLGSGKPVIGVTPAEGTAARVLRETGHLTCDVADDAVYRLFADVLDQKLTVKPVLEKIEQYHYLHTSRQLAETIRTIAGEKRH